MQLIPHAMRSVTNMKEHLQWDMRLSQSEYKNEQIPRCDTMKSCRKVPAFRQTCCLRRQGNRILWHVGTILPGYMVSHPSEWQLLCKSGGSHRTVAKIHICRDVMPCWLVNTYPSTYPWRFEFLKIIVFVTAIYSLHIRSKFTNKNISKYY